MVSTLVSLRLKPFVDQYNFSRPDCAPDEPVGDEEVDEGDDAGGDETSPVEVVEDVVRVLTYLRDVVVHDLQSCHKKSISNRVITLDDATLG